MIHPIASRAALSTLALTVVLILGCDSGSSPTAPSLPAAAVPGSTSLAVSTVEAMRTAIDDEYLARATYDAVMDRHGRVAPFVNIRRAEDNHARALADLFANHGLDVPADTRAGTVAAPPALQLACQAGVEAELANIAMYDDLLETATEPDVIRVFSSNRAASLDNHLPAFRRCS